MFTSEVLCSKKEASKDSKLVQELRKSNLRRVNAEINSASPIFSRDGVPKPKQQQKRGASSTETSSKNLRKKLKVEDPSRTATPVDPEKNPSIFPPPPQTRRVQTSAPTPLNMNSSSMPELYMKHQMYPRGDTAGKGGVSSQNPIGEWHNSFPTADYQGPQDYYRHPSPGQSGRPSFYQNYNAAGSHFDGNYWNHNQAHTTPQNPNFGMWSGPGYPITDGSSMSYTHPVHQHHYRPQPVSMGSENMHAGSTGFYGGPQRIQHTAATQENSYVTQQGPWNSQASGRNCTSESEGYGNHFNEGQPTMPPSKVIPSTQVSTSCPEDSVLTPLTTFYNPEQSIHPGAEGTTSPFWPSHTPSPLHQHSPNPIHDPTTSQDIEIANMVVDESATELVTPKTPIPIVTTEDGKEDETMDNGPHRSDEADDEEADDLSIASKESHEPFQQSPEDWRQVSEERDVDIEDDGETLRNQTVNRMARSLAAFLPKPGNFFNS